MCLPILNYFFLLLRFFSSFDFLPCAGGFGKKKNSHTHTHTHHSSLNLILNVGSTSPGTKHLRTHHGIRAARTVEQELHATQFNEEAASEQHMRGELGNRRFYAIKIGFLKPCLWSFLVAVPGFLACSLFLAWKTRKKPHTNCLQTGPVK